MPHCARCATTEAGSVDSSAHPCRGGATPAPRRRESGLRQPEALRVVRRAQGVDHEVALELRVGTDDAHGKDRRRLIEEPLRREDRRGERQDALMSLETHTLVGHPGRAAREREDILRRVRIGEQELRGHAF